MATKLDEVRIIWEGPVTWTDYCNKCKDEQDQWMPDFHVQHHRLTIGPSGNLRLWGGYRDPSLPTNIHYLPAADVSDCDSEVVYCYIIRQLDAKLQSVSEEKSLEDTQQQLNKLAQENAALEAQLRQLKSEIKQLKASTNHVTETETHTVSIERKREWAEYNWQHEFKIDSVRARIIKLLAEKYQDIPAIAHTINAAQSTVEKYLNHLHTLGIVTKHTDGNYGLAISKDELLTAKADD